jgi:endonuclease/exonuclease/phosphatase (EEP) superfamily protein YafD
VGKDTLRLINNHLESYKLQSEDMSDVNKIEQKWRRATPLRNAQARVIRSEIEMSPYPVIVVGDFNAVALSYAYWHISTDLHDAWNETHHFWEMGTTYNYKGFGVRIDYILCSDPLQPVSCEVKETTGSDHKPVVATLEW